MANKKSTKYKSVIQEKKIAKDINGKTTIASGSTWIQKADVRTDTYLIEAKTTEKSYYPLGFNTWYRINEQAVKDGLRIPLMSIELNNGEATSTHLAVMYHMDLTALMEEVKSLDQLVLVGEERKGNKSIRINSKFLDYWLDRCEVTTDSNYILVERVELTGHKLLVFQWDDLLYLLKRKDV